MKKFFIYIAIFVVMNNILMATTKIITDKQVELWSVSWWVGIIAAYIIANAVSDALDKP